MKKKSKPLMLELGRDYINHYTALMSDFTAVIKNDLSHDIDSLSEKQQQEVAKRLRTLRQICTQIIKIEPNYPSAYFWRGIAHAKTGDEDKALRNLKQAKEISQKLNEQYKKEQEKKDACSKHQDTSWLSQVRNLLIVPLRKGQAWLRRICRRPETRPEKA